MNGFLLAASLQRAGQKEQARQQYRAASRKWHKEVSGASSSMAEVQAVQAESSRLLGLYED
jgi:hypothetical protein